MSTKMLVATLLGTVVSFFLGWVIFGMLLDPYYKSNSVVYPGLMRGESEIRLYAIALANLCWSGLLAYIFDKWANIRTAGTGFMAGLIVFGLVFAGFNFMQWSMMNLVPYKVYIVDAAVNAVYGGVIGAVIGWFLGRSKTA